MKLLHVPKRYLLFTAAIVWTFAASMLLTRGFIFMHNVKDFIVARLLFSFIGGILFYYFMFTKISKKHIQRVLSMENDTYPLFKVFSLRSYILLTIMISGGITLRKSGIIAPEYLSFLYITMGIPLLISAVRFYYTTFCFERFATNKL